MSNEKNINKFIDHTILKPDATLDMVKKVCDEAKQYDFASVCVNSCHVKTVSNLLEGTDVLTCCVVGFPLGACLSSSKAFETKASIEQGANEVDMVINVGAAKDGNWEFVKDDIKAVVMAADKKAKVKVILETCLLTDDEIVKACECAKSAGADFVKTSTGFSTGGATKEHVALMRKTVGPDMGVKASGGVRTLEDAKTMIENGATRLGASSGVAIMNGLKSDSDY